MAAATGDQDNIGQRTWTVEEYLPETGEVFYLNTIAGIIGGTARVGAATAAMVGIGVCKTSMNATAGHPDLDENPPRKVRIEYDTVGEFDNSAAGDEIDADDYGSPFYVVDNNTVALTDGGGARPQGGIIKGITADGKVKCYFE